jgi:hypothetical protein
MSEKREVCTCTNCGNEAEMVVTCQLIDVEEKGKTVKKQKETRKCTSCGSEADMIIDFDE